MTRGSRNQGDLGAELEATAGIDQPASGADRAMAADVEATAGGESDVGPRRTKAGQREATTAALMAAARELFTTPGYASVGTEEIVQRAGVSRGALYHYFGGGKEELFRAVLVQISAETAKQVAGDALAHQDPWEALNVGVDAFLDACARPDIQRIVLVDGPSVLGWDVWRAIDSEHVLGLVEAALQRAIDAGQLAAQPADALAQVLLGALHEAAMVVANAGDPIAARVEMGTMVRRLLNGLRGPAP